MLWQYAITVTVISLLVGTLIEVAEPWSRSPWRLVQAGCGLGFLFGAVVSVIAFIWNV